MRVLPIFSESSVFSCQLDKLSGEADSIVMKALPVGELKARFSAVLEKVKEGESFGILYGKTKKPVAMIVPYVEKVETEERRIGLLDGKVNIRFAPDFKMTEEELLGLS